METTYFHTLLYHFTSIFSLFYNLWTWVNSKHTKSLSKCSFNILPSVWWRRWRMEVTANMMESCEVHEYTNTFSAPLYPHWLFSQSHLLKTLKTFVQGRFPFSPIFDLWFLWTVHPMPQNISHHMSNPPKHEKWKCFIVQSEIRKMYKHRTLIHLEIKSVPENNLICWIPGTTNALPSSSSPEGGGGPIVKNHRHPHICHHLYQHHQHPHPHGLYHTFYQQ